MNGRTRPTNSDTYFGEDNIIERCCFLPELCRNWRISGEEILRDVNDKDGVLGGKTSNGP